MEQIDIGDNNGETCCETKLSRAAACHTFTPRRLPEVDEADTIAQETLELLERMRVDLNQMKGSIDLKENTERQMATRAARYMGTTKQVKDDGVQPRLLYAGFVFFPMPTAPVTSLLVYDSEEAMGLLQQQHSGRRHVDVGMMADCPPWNASTSLQRSEKLASKKAPSSSLSPARERALGSASTILSHGSLLAARKPDSTGAKKKDIFLNNDDVYSSTTKIDRVSREDEMWIRDYLRRLNIIGSEFAESDERIYDPLLNGVALCRLVGLALNKTNCKGSTIDFGIVLSPRNIEDVRINYVAALTALRGLESSLHLGISKECRLIRPERVILGGDSAALILLMRTIAHASLPITCEQLWSIPSMTWQPDLTGKSYAPDDMRALELATCNFLHSLEVLADQVAHQLPPDDSIVPNALGAPFLPPQKKNWVFRKECFFSLYVPSVFPFLANGTALCDVVERVTGSHLSVHRNPRVRSKCIENIETAFTELHKYSPSKIGSLFINAPARVFYGDRRYILLLLEDIMRLADGAPPRKHLPSFKDKPYIQSQHFAGRSHSSSRLQMQKPLFSLQATEVACPENELLTLSFTQKGDSKGRPQSPVKSASRCFLASPLSLRKERENLVVTKKTCAYQDLQTEARTTLCALNSPTTLLGEIHYGEDEMDAMRNWLVAVLGTDFKYAAADHSFSVSFRDFVFSERCFLFSDGVVLAHLIRTLERRRCTELECIDVNAKAIAAKRRNIKKCVLFLQTVRRILLNVPLLEDILIAGDLIAVLFLVQSLKNAYRFAVRT